MIKTGINLTPHISAELIRLLLKHPDVDIRWVSGASMPAEGVGAVFDQLQGEVGNIPTSGSLNDINLYIGNDFVGLDQFVGSRENAKAIIVGPLLRMQGYDEAILGVCELNRKAMVRGGVLGIQPDVPTLLGAIALMPLAKHLMLNGPIYGTMMLPYGTPMSSGKFRMEARTLGEGTLRTLRDEVLSQLQASFSSPMEITSIENHASSFACVVLSLDLKVEQAEVEKIYREFYSDHRHIVFPTHPINDAMVMGTNKSVVSLGRDSLGRLLVTVGFDASMKGGAGNVLHMLNLLYGLDELTGF